MAADLHFWHPSYINDAKGKLTARGVNILNAPIISATWLNNGSAIADVYELIFNKSGSLITCTVDALIHGGKNPYRNMAGVSVIADGTTRNDDVIPGVGLVLSASTDTGWKCRVAVMNFLNDDGSYEAFFGYGIVEEGMTTAGQRVAIKNVGSDDAANCMAYALPGLHWGGTGASAIITRIAPHTNPARHKMAVPGTYVITFSDWKFDSGTGKYTCDILVNGNVAVNDAQMDGVTVFQYGVAGYDDTNDYLRGLQIVLANTTADPTSVTATLTVATSGYQYMQFAPDVGGTPGTYAAQDLQLTEPGQSAGTITAGGAAFLWHRFAPPDGAGPGAIREAVPRLRCLSI